MSGNNNSVLDAGDTDKIFQTVLKEEANPELPGEKPPGKRSTGQVILAELLKVLEPVAEAADVGPGEVARLLEESGVGPELFAEGDIDKVADTLAATTETIESVQAVFEGEQPNVAEVPDLLLDIVSVVKSIKGLDEVELKDPDIDALGENLLDFLLIEYFEREHPTVYAFLVLGAVIVPHDDKPDELDLQRLPELLNDAGDIPTTVLKWGTQDFDPALLLYLLKLSFDQIGVPTVSQRIEQSEMSTLGQVQQDPSKAPEELEIPAISGQFGTAGLRLVPLPGDGSKNPGLALVPFGTGQLDVGKTIDLGGPWQFTTELTGEASASGWGLAVRPTRSGVSANLRDLKQGSNLDVQLAASSELTFTGKTEDGEKMVLLGQPDGTRVSLGSISAKAGLSYDGTKVGYQFALPSSGTLAVAPGDADNFLSKVLPPEGIAYNFEAEAGYASDRGLYFEQSGTLEVSIPTKATLGPVTLQEIYLAVEAAKGQGGSGGRPPPFKIPVGASVALDIGFLTATVDRMGVEANVSFPEVGQGNAGLFDIDVGFKPPNGIGLSLDLPSVSGGGVIRFYPDENRYSGAIQLRFDDFSITAIGLLKTQLPGGEDGYSFLLLITANIPAIDLGYGFKLTGIGGMFGLHRSFKTKPLRKAVRTGHANSILFPKQVVKHSDRIISDLRSFFPPTKGQHVAGPMAQISWGAANKMVTMDIGVIVQWPQFKIGLVGDITLGLPKVTSDLVNLNLTVLGVLVPREKRLAVDGALYDSKILVFTVSGQMAMRLRWGDDSGFLLSVGGFHPRFDPPSSFPDLDRIKASLSKPDSPVSVELKGYLATSPNTFQVGAGAFLHGELGPVVVDGKLSFDALFQFDPFEFVVDFLAVLSVTYNGNGLDVSVDGTFKGPNPFHVTGKVHIDVVFLSVTKRIDATIGQRRGTETLPAATVLTELRTALGKPGNWSATLPEGGSSLVTLRQPEGQASGGAAGSGQSSNSQSSDGDSGGQSTVQVHPLGGLGVRQTVVPLGTEIQKYGSARPATYDTFRIQSISVDGETVERTEPTRERFAPAKYKRMSDSEKLSSPSFVERTAGRSIGGERVYYGGQPVQGRSTADWRTTAAVSYETAVVDERNEQPPTSLGRLGSFATMRPERVRVGVPASKLPELLPNSRLGRTEIGIRGAVAGERPEVYGVPGGTARGERRAAVGTREWRPGTTEPGTTDSAGSQPSREGATDPGEDVSGTGRVPDGTAGGDAIDGESPDVRVQEAATEGKVSTDGAGVTNLDLAGGESL